MTDLSCLNTIITDNLAVHIDLTNLKSWNLNTGFTSISLTKWNKAISDNIFLYDFGLTAYDNGRIDRMHDTLTILPTDNKVTLYRVGHNNPKPNVGEGYETGTTLYDTYGITGITGASATTFTTIITGGTGSTGTTIITGVTSFAPYAGNFFELNGGYLQGFFKLKNYNFELLPPRYGSGVTIETIIRIIPQSFNDGYFYFMGARAENKYVPAFSGESIQFTGSTTAVTTGSFGSSTKVIKTLQFSGITTSENHFLNNYMDQQVMKSSTNTPDLFVTSPVATDDQGIRGNTIGFFISSDRRIGYTRINPSGLTESNLSSNQIAHTGWTIIDIVFKPYEIITDRSILDCTASRTGDFTVYVNGRRFWKVADFDEYYFKGFKTQREKQLGVPYNISWGGGSFGLKNSYHYDLHQYALLNKTSITSIATGFTFTTDPFWSDPTCPVPPLDHNITATTITGDSSTFHYADPCGTGTTAATVLKIHNTSLAYTVITASTFITGATIITGSTGGTGHTGTTFITGYTTVTGTTIAFSATTLNQYNLLYHPDLILLSNRDYIFSVDVYQNDIFVPYHDGVIGMFFSGQTDITIVEALPYNIIEQHGFTWTRIQYKIRTKENTGLSKVHVGLYIKSDTTLVPDFTLYFDKFNYRGADTMSKDHTKDNELIQELYDKSFIGGIQKLRIYDTAFNSQQVLHNALIEAKNPAYGFLISAGGRIIYK